MAEVAELVRMSRIGKRYGGVQACREVDFTLGAGEVHALLGENGAGKSTLMKILSGDVTDYDGQIEINGSPVTFNGPTDAQAAGIAMIHQELDLVPGLSVADNIFLGRELRTELAYGRPAPDGTRGSRAAGTQRRAARPAPPGRRTARRRTATRHHREGDLARRPGADHGRADLRADHVRGRATVRR